MTSQEANLLVAFAEQHWTIKRLGTLGFSKGEGSFVRLHAAPCPFLEGQSTCSVHAIRPYNCRRFGCMRPDVKAEKLVLDRAMPITLYRDLGCANLRERLIQSRAVRRLYANMQRKAQRWARQHGWSDNDARDTNHTSQ